MSEQEKFSVEELKEQNTAAQEVGAGIRPPEPKKPKKRSINRGLRISSWIDVNEVKEEVSGFGVLFSEFKKAFLELINARQRTGNDTSPTKYASFEAMLQELNLSDAQLEAFKRSLYKNSMVYLIAAAAGVLGVGYLYISGAWLLGLLSMVFPTFLLIKAAQARRMLFQLQHQLTSCTFKQWLDGIHDNQNSGGAA